MNVKKPKTYPDGVVCITSSDSSGVYRQYDGVHYRNEVMGVKRFYAAAAANLRIDRVISIPFLEGIEPEMVFDITYDRHGTVGKYVADQVQLIEDTARPEYKITLRRYGRGKTRWEEPDYGI